MKSTNITQIALDKDETQTYTVSIAWRYGTSGLFTIANSSASVEPDINLSGVGNLTTPVTITFDETINNSIQLRITYNGCNSTPFYQTYSV